MGKLQQSYQFVAGALPSAADFNSNFECIINHINEADDDKTDSVLSAKVSVMWNILRRVANEQELELMEQVDGLGDD